MRRFTDGQVLLTQAERVFMVYTDASTKPISTHHVTRPTLWRSSATG